MSKTQKLKKSISDLEYALTFKDRNKDPFFFGGISKAFEVCLDYSWKYFKYCAEVEGLEPY
jgi:hypothetical protein